LVFRGIPPIITYLSTWQHEHTSVVKALYDYDAANPGELTIKEEEILYVHDKEDAWLLVHSQKPGGRVGFIPETYVEEVRLSFVLLHFGCMLIECRLVRDQKVLLRPFLQSQASWSHRR